MIKIGKITHGSSFEVQYYYYYDDGREPAESERNSEDNINHEIKTSSQNSASFLRGTVSSWYVAIRNICIVLMLSVLIYIGIRMMLTSVASDKAKYKEMLKDWVTGLCLLFIMHYIMAFSVTLVGKITEVVSTSVDSDIYIEALQQPDQGAHQLKDAAEKLGLSVSGEDSVIVQSEGKEYLLYPTNLMGKLRIEQQMKDDTGQWLGLTVVMVMLVVFTVIFTFIYLKRVLYMAFLTIIAPLVALTYCIDKTNDGKAQGFNMWLKEYIFNLLIQPMHLLLYFILITSAMSLAGQNVIYSIVAIAFMMPAEKLLRSLFGFEKAKTPPSLLGATAGTSMAMSALNRLKGVGPQEKRKGVKGEGAESDKIKTPNDLGGNVNGTQSIAAGLNMREDENTGARVQRSANINSGEGEEGSPEQPPITFPMDAPDDYGEVDSTDSQLSEGQLQMAFPMDIPDDYGDIGQRQGSLEPPIRTHEITGDEMEEDGNESNGIDNLDDTDVNPTVTQSPARYTPISTSDTTAFMNRVREARDNGSFDGFKRLGRYVKPKAIKGAKTLGKNVLRAQLAGAGMMIGGAIAAAGSGDFSKTAQAMAAGGAAGVGLGTGILNRGENIASTSGQFIQGARDAYHGDDPEYERKQQEKQVKKAMKNVELRNAISRKIGEKGLKEMEEKGDLKKYIENGVQEPDEMVALHKLKEEKNISTEAAIGTWQLHRDMAGGKDTTTMTGRDKVTKAMQGKYSREVTQGDQQRADALTDKTMDYMDAYSRILFKHN